jgi:hypothetical protein
MTLADAVMAFCSSPIGEVEQDHTGLRWDRIADVVSCLRKRHEEAGRIERIAQETLPLLEEIRDHLDDQRRVNRLIARIDVLRSRMDTLGRCYDLIAQLTQYTELQRFEADRKIAAARVKGSDKQRRQVLRDIENVRGMGAAAAVFQALIADVIARLVAEHGLSDEDASTAQKEAA